jgi:prefoldin subunit 5
MDVDRTITSLFKKIVELEKKIEKMQQSINDLKRSPGDPQYGYNAYEDQIGALLKQRKK